MNRNYFKYLLRSNKFVIAFVFIVNALIYVIERINQNFYFSSLFSNTGNIVFFFILCFVLPVLMFHHVQNKRSVDSYFALPVKRRNMAITSIVFAILLIVFPWLFISLANIVINFENIWSYLILFGIVTLSSIVLIMFNSAVYLLGNNNVDGIIIMICYSIIPFVFVWLYDTFLRQICYGFYSVSGNLISYLSLISSSYLYLVDINNVEHLLPWAITLVAYFVFGYVGLINNYLKRKVERAETISSQIFAYPFVIYALTIILLTTVSVSYCNDNDFGGMILLYFLITVMFVVLRFIYQRKFKLEIKQIVVVLVTIILSISAVKIAFHYEGFGLSYLYDHNPKNMWVNYNAWNCTNEELEKLLNEKYDLNYYTVYFDFSIPEAQMENKKEINEWLNNLRDEAIKDYFEGNDSFTDASGYNWYNDSRLYIVNNCTELNGEVNRTYNAEEVSYSYYDIVFSLDELKYINENIAKVYIDADINVTMEDATEGINDKSDAAVLTSQSDYIVISLDELLSE
ncbi:MAG: hypothetical protein ACI4WM_03125 [Erysipelotrichaceae bacterium]